MDRFFTVTSIPEKKVLFVARIPMKVIGTQPVNDLALARDIIAARIISELRMFIDMYQRDGCWSFVYTKGKMKVEWKDCDCGRKHLRKELFEAVASSVFHDLSMDIDSSKEWKDLLLLGRIATFRAGHLAKLLLEADENQEEDSDVITIRIEEVEGMDLE